jgi:predicted RNase H-like HicB family nuclease
MLKEQPEGGYIVTSKDLPGLFTQGDTKEEAVNNAEDAAMALIEIYEELGRLPKDIKRYNHEPPKEMMLSNLIVSNSNYVTT